MLNYETKIKTFVEKNFKKGNPEVESHWHTSKEVLNILFSAFPKGCIDEYELNDILEPFFERKLRVRAQVEIKDGEVIEQKSSPRVFWIINISE